MSLFLIGGKMDCPCRKLLTLNNPTAGLLPQKSNLGHMASHFFRNCVYKELDKRDQSESLIVKSSNDNSQPSLSVTLIVKEIEDAELPTPFSSRVLQSFSQQLCPSLRDSSIKGVLQVETSSISQECLQFIEVSDKTLVTAYFLNPKEVWIKSQILHESNGKCKVTYVATYSVFGRRSKLCSPI